MENIHAGSALRFLGIAEMYQSVLEDMDKPTLSAMAQTCQKFSTCALDALWREVGSIVPLMKTLPPLVCREEYHVGIGSQWTQV